MATKLIELQDDILVEIDVPGDQIEQISGGTADKVDASIGMIKQIFSKICKPIYTVWQDLNKDMHIEQAEVEVGLGFEAEGNLYIAKSKANTNIKVKLTLKPKEQSCSQGCPQ